MAPSALLLPRPPSPRKRTSDRVSTLLLDNLELFDAPLISNSSSNKAPRLELPFQNTNNANNNKSALMENALQRLREKAAVAASMTTTASVVSQQQHRQRRAPTLPERRPSPSSRRNNDGIDGSASSSSSSSSSSTNNSNKVDMDSPATPIRSPPVRSNSGLARCA